MKTTLLPKHDIPETGLFNFKTTLFTVIVLMQLTALHLQAQKTRMYCWITFTNSSVERQGELTGLTDTSVCVHFFGAENQPDFSPTIPVSMISQIRCDIEKKTGKRHTGIGILIGMGTGLITGAVIGSTYRYSPTYNSSPVGNALGNAVGALQSSEDEAGSILLGILIGGLGGGIIGGISHAWVIQSPYTLQINGNLKSYQQNIEKLKMYVVTSKQKS